MDHTRRIGGPYEALCDEKGRTIRKDSEYVPAEAESQRRRGLMALYRDVTNRGINVQHPRDVAGIRRLLVAHRPELYGPGAPLDLKGQLDDSVIGHFKRDIRDAEKLR
jgi:hypothetical protein